MDLEGKFTPEGMPIVTDEFQKFFFFELRMDESIKRPDRFSESLLVQVSHFQDNLPFSFLSAQFAQNFGTEGSPDHSYVLGGLLLGSLLLEKQGKAYFPPYRLPGLEFDLCSHIVGQFGTSREKRYNLSQEVKQENPFYTSSLADFMNEIVGNHQRAVFVLDYFYKFYKEQARKDGLYEKIRKELSGS